MSGASIRRLDDSLPYPSDLAGAVVAVGNFDGVHRGHQAVLAEARALAGRLGAPLVCLTFEPHPRTVFRPEQPVARLTPARLKARLLDGLGFDAVVEWPFSRSFAALSPEAFVDGILVGHLGARGVVVGHDFHFGARRAGTPAFLREAATARGFAVDVVEPLLDGAGHTVSSSRIRALLTAGDLGAANALLGWRWTTEGAVVHGAKLGRTLGYPTANLALQPDDLLAHGIYAVKLRRADGSLHDGVASYGRRPTFDDGAALLETFVFDFSGDLYGETVSVSLFARLRGEERFDSAEALVEQMDRDSVDARAVLAEAAPLSELDRATAF